MARYCEKPDNSEKSFADNAQMNDFDAVSLRALRLFVAVLDEGSFSEVARRAGVAPSSVSRVIQQLEQQLHTQLLYRNTRALAPTEAGLAFSHYARRMLEQADEAARTLQEREQLPGGLVRINAPVVFGQRHLAPWLAALAERYPKLNVELTQTDDYVDPLHTAADLLIRIGVLNDSSMHARPLARLRYRLAASPAYLARFGTPRTPEDLHAHHCLVFKGSSGPQRWFFRAREGEQPWHAYSLRGPLTGNNAETLTQAALDGLGLVLFPSWLIGEALHQGRLVRLLPDYQASITLEPSTLAALYPRSRLPSRNVRAVVDFLVEKMGNPPYWDR